MHHSRDEQPPAGAAHARALDSFVALHVCVARRLDEGTGRLARLDTPMEAGYHNATRPAVPPSSPPPDATGIPMWMVIGPAVLICFCIVIYKYTNNLKAQNAGRASAGRNNRATPI